MTQKSSTVEADAPVLEEPALFNENVERFVTLVEAGRWPVRDPRSLAAH